VWSRAGKSCDYKRNFTPPEQAGRDAGWGNQQQCCCCLMRYEKLQGGKTGRIILGPGTAKIESVHP